MVTENVTKKPMKSTLSGFKVRVLGGLAAVGGLAASASAAVDINATVGPILDSVTALIPTLINLIIAIVPAVITMAVVGFIVAFFDRILALIRV